MASRPATASTIGSRREADSQLLRAVLLPPEEAHFAWREWRASANLDKLSSEDYLLLPVLGARLTQWSAGDPAAGILRGVLRRAWTENQVRLGVLRSTVATLETADCGPVVVAGSAASCLLNRIEGSSRPIFDLRVVVPRDRISRAAAALQAAGWRLSGALPQDDVLDWISMVHLSYQDAAGQHHSLMLQWRVLPVVPGKAQACEEEYLRHSQAAEASLRTPGPAHALLAAMCGRFDFDPDSVPWEVDAALVPLHSIDWDRWTKLADAFAPEAFGRLGRLRSLGLPVPHISRPVPTPVIHPAPAPWSETAYHAYRTLRRRTGKLLRRWRRKLKGWR